MSADGKHADLTGVVIGAFFKVYNTLGYGFSEKVYERALAIELRKTGLQVETQKIITVYYDSEIVGDHVADMLINQAVIVELKAVRQLAAEHKRKVYDNARKGAMTWLNPASVAKQNL
jgi:GxxExxY protein